MAIAGLQAALSQIKIAWKEKENIYITLGIHISTRQKWSV